MLVGEVTENELLSRMVPLLATGRSTLIGPGDDAAVLRAQGDVVITSDTLVVGRHFRREWSSGADVGWRAAIANLADVMAMGGRPRALTVALQLPSDTEVAWVQDLAEGLAAACLPYGVGVVGGDLTSAGELAVAVTALGDMEDRDPVLRSGAQPGDVVAVAGVLGRSAAGLAVLMAADNGIRDVPGGEAFVAAHLRPDPPLLAGIDAARRGASAMLDISDGLAIDAGRIAATSGVGLALDSADLAPDVDEVAPAAEALGVDPLDWVMGGGEDHSLLATFAPESVPVPFRAIGRVVESGGLTLDGAPWAGPAGWEHFARL